jgi:hypothetical protein
MILSAYGFCHGERGAVRTSSIPIAADTILEANPIRGISVSQQIARRGVPRKGLGDLPREPDLGRVLGDLEMDDPSSMVIKDNHGIKQLKRRGRDHEHVDRRDGCHMVPQEAAPSRGGSVTAPREVPAQ